MLNLGLFLKIRIGFCFGEKNKILFLILFFIFKILCCADVENCGISFGEKNKILFLILFFIFKILCCADVENCGISKGFGFIYIYR